MVDFLDGVMFDGYHCANKGCAKRGLLIYASTGS